MGEGDPIYYLLWNFNQQNLFYSQFFSYLMY